MLSHFVIDACLSAGFTMHLPPHARVEDPIHELWAPDAQWILQVLVGPCAVTIDR